MRRAQALAVLALAGASLTGACYVGSQEDQRGPDERAWPDHERESMAALERWDRYGCEDGESCARFEHWARSRFYFACEGGASDAP